VTEPDLVTGEAVVLELRLAKVPSRALGFFMDGSVQILLLVGLIALLAAVGGVADFALTTALFIAGIASIFVIMPATIETLSHGRSLGKLTLGLRVVRDDGGPIRFRHALVRALAAFFVDLWLLGWLGIGLITSLASSRGKRVGDYLAGTVVVRERIPVRSGTVAQMPPHLAEWAARLDLSGIPNDLALAVRQYLSRIADLTPAVREDMGLRLATEVAGYIGQPAPPGVPAWAFLSAVLAERRNREIARMNLDTRQPAADPGSAPESVPVEAQPTQPADDQAGEPASAGADNPFAPPS
jgi:uncharacterized RDD family membrane protein YckC